MLFWLLALSSGSIGESRAAKVFDLEVLKGETSSGEIVVFQHYEKVISYLEKQSADKHALRRLGSDIAAELLSIDIKGLDIHLEALRDYRSSVTEITWLGMINELRSRQQRWKCSGSGDDKCSDAYNLLLMANFELLLSQSKQVYYLTTNSDKGLAHKRAVRTFSELRDLLEEGSNKNSSIEPNYLKAKTYLLAHELTNALYFKEVFAYRVNENLAIHFYGAEQFKREKVRYLRENQQMVIAEAERVRLSVEEKYRNRHDFKFFLDAALTKRFAQDYAYLLEDEKGRLLGDEWKLYNNAVPYFAAGLKRTIDLMDSGREMEDFGWSKIQLVNRNIKINAYQAKEGIELLWGIFKLEGEQIYAKVSKHRAWTTLEPFLDPQSVRIYRDRNRYSESEDIIVDGVSQGDVLGHVRSYL